MDIEAWRRSMSIEALNSDQLAILNVFVKEEIFDYETTCRTRAFVDHTGFTKYKVTKLRKELADLGFLYFSRGLVCEDRGGYFGSGYFLNNFSLPYVIREFERLKGK